MRVIITAEGKLTQFYIKGVLSMSESFISAMSYLCGFIVGLVAVFICKAIMKKKRFFDRDCECEYDERQLLARNSAYKGAFFTLAAYCLLCGLMGIWELEWAMLSVQMIAGMLLSATVFVIICIFKDAYFTGKGNTMVSFLVFSIFMCAIQTFSFVMSVFVDGESIFTDGVLNVQIIAALCAVVFLSCAVATTIKMIMNRKSCEEE